MPLFGDPGTTVVAAPRGDRPKRISNKTVLLYMCRLYLVLVAVTSSRHGFLQLNFGSVVQDDKVDHLEVVSAIIVVEDRSSVGDVTMPIHSIQRKYQHEFSA
jgi:hypothetical protein